MVVCSNAEGGRHGGRSDAGGTRVRHWTTSPSDAIAVGKHRSSRLSFRLASLFSSSAAVCVGKPLGSTRMVAATLAGSQEGPKFDVDFTTSNTRSSVTATEQLVD